MGKGDHLKLREDPGFQGGEGKEFPTRIKTQKLCNQLESQTISNPLRKKGGKYSRTVSHGRGRKS